jgi:membrane dipeptidase
MTATVPIPVFDGHNDVLSRMRGAKSGDPIQAFLDGEPNGHIDLPRARAGGLAGGLCAIFVPPPSMRPDANGDFLAPGESDALRETMAQARLLFDLERRSGGAITVCRSADAIRKSLAAGSFAAIFHVEGLEMVGPDLDALTVLHQAGLRTLGPVWSRPNIFAHGVPFRYPSSPDIGPGLTDAGQSLIAACNRLKILVDLSHMNEQGFWDVERISEAPLVASHSNAHVLCPHSRNLTDRQLDAIGASHGLVGINFGVLFLREDGVKRGDTTLERIVDHIVYVADRIGINHVAFGSDFDGTMVPDGLKDAGGLPRLMEALERRGFDQDALEKIAHRNWIDVLERTWGG